MAFPFQSSITYPAHPPFQLIQLPIQISSGSFVASATLIPRLLGRLRSLFLKPIELIAIANRIRDGVPAIDNNGRQRIG